MQEILEYITNGLVRIVNILDTNSFTIWSYNVTFLDLFISLMFVEFILSVIFPWFDSTED